MQNRTRKIISMSVDPAVAENFDKIAKEIGMTRSRFFEFMVKNMQRADEVPFGDYIEEILKSLTKKKKK